MLLPVLQTNYKEGPNLALLFLIKCGSLHDAVSISDYTVQGYDDWRVNKVPKGTAPT